MSSIQSWYLMLVWTRFCSEFLHEIGPHWWQTLPTTYINSSQYSTLRAAELHQNLCIQVESSRCDHTVPTVGFTAMLAALGACTAFAHLLKAKCLPFPANMLAMFTSWSLGQHVYHSVSVQCYNMLTFAKRKAINTDSAAKNVIRRLSINYLKPWCNDGTRWKG